MPGRRLALAAAVAACCAVTAVAVGAQPFAGQAGAAPDALARSTPIGTLPPLAPPRVAPPRIAPPRVSAGDPGLASLSAVVASAPADPPMTATSLACGTLPRFSRATADEILAGRLTIAPFAAVTVDPLASGTINWKLNPLGNPTWGQDFRSGGWIEDLIVGYLAGGPTAQAYLARAERITAGWLRAIPASGRDPQTLVCIAQAFPGQAWIQNQIPPTVDYYAAHWMGAWNHGLLQDIKLLRIGCAYPAAAFNGAALRWRRTAVAQLTAAFEPNPLGPAIDAQGAVNEQSTLYEDFVYNLWQSAVPLLAACGYRLPGAIMARIAKVPAFLGAATQPDGRLVQIGDVYVERPATSPHSRRLVSVYQAGYVFGRSGWTPAASFYSLRFGRGRQVHGHNDHLGLTYFARGRNLIVDAGHTGYENTPYRAWLQSPEAASALVMPGVPFSAASATSLVTDRIGRYGQFYEVYDTAFGGDPRYRSVYVSQRPDLMVVFDRASGADTYQQLWHLDPALHVAELGSSYAVASAPGTRLSLLRVPLPGQAIPPGSTQVIRGQTNPYQGWVSQQMLQRVPADVVAMTSTGPSAAMLTLIVPAAAVTRVAYSLSGPLSGPYLLRVTVGAKVATFTITARGIIG